MTVVKLYGVTPAAKQVELGTVTWDGEKVVGQGSRAATLVAQSPIVVYQDQKRVILTPDDGEEFVNALQHHYTGSYLRAGPPQKN